MSSLRAREIVVPTRVLRDGSIIEERVERWLAELIMGCIPHEEPQVARARITPLPVDDYRTHYYFAKKDSESQLYQRAFALLQAAYGDNPLRVKQRRVA